MSALDTQVGGDHYKKLAIQPIEYILGNNLGFAEGNIVKYITRWKDKGGIEDLRKVIHYAEFLIEHEANLRSYDPNMPHGATHADPAKVQELVAMLAEPTQPALFEDPWGTGDASDKPFPSYPASTFRVTC
jgi:hypothetical protein